MDIVMTGTLCSALRITIQGVPSSVQVHGQKGDLEEKMATLLRCANALNRSIPEFTEAQRLLERQDSIIGRIVRRAEL